MRLVVLEWWCCAQLALLCRLKAPLKADSYSDSSGWTTSEVVVVLVVHQTSLVVLVVPFEMTGGMANLQQH